MKVDSWKFIARCRLSTCLEVAVIRDAIQHHGQWTWGLGFRVNVVPIEFARPWCLL